MGYSFDDIMADPSEGRLVIISIITIPLCIVATILRLCAPKPSERRFRWDDLFAVLALLGFLAYACTPFVGVAVAGDLDDDGLATLAAKLSYLCTPFFYVNQLLARGSLFVLYCRIFWSDRAFVSGGMSRGAQPGYCIDGNAILVAEETVNSSLDFAMIALTVAVIRKLPTRNHIKSKLAFIFVVGGLSGVVGFVKIGLVYSAANTCGQENDTNASWDILQMATSIFCACAPMVKIILPAAGLWIRLDSSIRSRSSDSQRYELLPDSMTTVLSQQSGSQGGNGENGVSKFGCQ
ncbi:hypothetical protein BJ170DRAFT_694422 [Xylariales sp. AK1849]|nr:hypothetical protein BJ170DRAFT_694422 [Xylariales sp. AK1849]